MKPKKFYASIQQVLEITSLKIREKDKHDNDKVFKPTSSQTFSNEITKSVSAKKIVGTKTENKISKSKIEVNTQVDHEEKLLKLTCTQTHSNDTTNSGYALNVEGEKTDKTLTEDKKDVNAQSDPKKEVFKLEYPKADSDGTLKANSGA